MERGAAGGGIGGEEDSVEVMLAVMKVVNVADVDSLSSAPTATAAFARKLHLRGVLNSLKTQHSVQRQQLRRRTWRQW